MAEDANGSTTTTAPGSSTEQDTTVGSTSTQPADGSQVDSGQAEGNGNSGSSDGSNGSDSGDEERRRPSRAERRISELSSEIDKLRGVEAENQRLRELLDNPLAEGSIKLPDRSSQSEITTEQYTQDVVSVADQIVKARLTQIIGANNQALTQQQNADRAVRELKDAPKKYKVLDSNSEQYDPVLETYLSKQFERNFKADPSSSFDDLVEETLAIRGQVANTNTNSSGTNKAASQGALKPTANKAPHKPVEQMTSDEYLAYMRSNR